MNNNDFINESKKTLQRIDLINDKIKALNIIDKYQEKWDIYYNTYITKYQESWDIYSDIIYKWIIIKESLNEKEEMRYLN